MNATSHPEQDEHYLKRELYDSIQEDPAIFDFLQTGSLDGLWYWDLEKPENEWMNERFWEILGLDPREMPHRADAWQNLIHPEDLQKAVDNFEKHCADPDHPYDQIVRYRHRDGSTVWVRCRGLAIRDATGKPIRMLGAHTDLTELMGVKESLEKANSQLKQANEELADFARMTSHDVREPLRTIAGFAALLKEDHASQLDETGLSHVDFVIKAAHRLDNLILSLKDYCSLDNRIAPTSVFSIVEPVQTAMDDLQALVAESKAIIEIGSTDQAPEVRGVARQLELVFRNLVVNAIRYCKEKTPRVSISFARHPGKAINDALQPLDEYLVISIKDNGIGIDPEYRKKVFERFERLHPQEEYQGSGLGLAICRKIVGQHEGAIWVESGEEGGSVFQVALPAVV